MELRQNHQAEWKHGGSIKIAFRFNCTFKSYKQMPNQFNSIDKWKSSDSLIITL